MKVLVTGWSWFWTQLFPVVYAHIQNGGWVESIGGLGWAILLLATIAAPLVITFSVLFIPTRRDYDLIIGFLGATVWQLIWFVLFYGEFFSGYSLALSIKENPVNACGGLIPCSPDAYNSQLNNAAAGMVMAFIAAVSTCVSLSLAIYLFVQARKAHA